MEDTAVIETMNMFLHRVNHSKINLFVSLDEDAMGWSKWSAYTPCNSRCMKYRQRVCFSARSYCPGADSHGIQTDRIKCAQEECYGKLEIEIACPLFTFPEENTSSKGTSRWTGLRWDGCLGAVQLA